MFGRATIRLGIGPHSSWLCFPGMMSSLAKSKQIISAQFQTFFLQYSFFMFVNIQIYLIILKTYNQHNHNHNHKIGV